LDRSTRWLPRKANLTAGLAGRLLVLVGRYGSRFRIPPEIASLIRRIPQERRYGAVRVLLYLQSLRITNDHPEDLSRLRVGRISWKTHRPGPNQRLNLSKFRVAGFNSMRSSFLKGPDFASYASTTTTTARPQWTTSGNSVDTSPHKRDPARKVTTGETELPPQPAPSCAQGEDFREPVREQTPRSPAKDLCWRMQFQNC
jgi:hypothetical protein